MTLASPSKFLTGTIFLHAHLQAVYYNCVKFNLNPMSRLGGDAFTSPSLHTERISEYKLTYLPFQIWTIFLHAHLQVAYYNCVKFHKNPISCLGGVVLTRYMDGRMDRVIPIYPPNLWNKWAFSGPLKSFKKKSLSVLFLLLLFIFHFFIKLDLQSHMFMSKTK